MPSDSLPQPSEFLRVERTQFQSTISWLLSCWQLWDGRGPATHIFFKAALCSSLCLQSNLFLPPWLFSHLWKHEHILGIKVTELWQELCHPLCYCAHGGFLSVFHLLNLSCQRHACSRVQKSAQLLSWSKSQDWDPYKEHSRFLPTWRGLGMPLFPQWAWKNA